MAFNLDQEILLRGIGAGYLNSVTGKFVEITSGQDLKFDIQATLDDVFAGDSMFAKYTYITKKEGTIEISAADFKASQMGLAQGVTYDTVTAKRMQRVLVTKTSTTLGATLTGVTDVICKSQADGSLIEVVAATPGTDKVAITATGGITWGSAVLAGEYAVWFKSDSTTSVATNMLKSAMPEVAALNWMFTTVDKDDNKYQVDVYAKRVRSDGKFTLDTARDKASVQKLVFKILDPGDGNENFATVTITRI